jgi:hypothetical protein
MDSSGSLGKAQWENAKEFVIGVVRGLDVGPQGVR